MSGLHERNRPQKKIWRWNHRHVGNYNGLVDFGDALLPKTLRYLWFEASIGTGMITDRVSIIIDDKKSHYSLINKAVRIIKDTYNGGFKVNDLISLDSFTTEEKEYLKNIFSHKITGLYAWEHSFYFQKGVWKYEESDYNYEKSIRDILLLLNNSTTSIGEKVYTNDYRLIENLFRGWNNLWDDDVEGVHVENRIYEVNFDAIEFISHNLQSRIGDSCKFNFEFVKTFMESLCDYHAKRLHEIIMKGKEPQS